MTVDRLVRLWLFIQYGKAWRTNKVSNGKVPATHLAANDYNPHSNVLLLDATMKIKYIGKNIRNGVELVRKQILSEALEFLSRPHTESAYICFDLVPGQINKQRTQSNRAKSNAKTPEMMMPVKTSDDPPITITDPNLVNPTGQYTIDDDFPIINNSRIPTGKEWDAFLKNKKLFPELIHYITSFMIDPISTGCTNKDATIQVPKNKKIFLWGGSLNPPLPRSVRINMDVTNVQKDTFESAVFYIGNCYNEESGMYENRSGRVAPSTFDLNTLRNLKEAELSIMYFITKIPDSNFTVVSGDGDLIWLLLFQSRDRINPDGTWRNRVFLRLIKRSTSDFKVTEPTIEEIDINLLYSLIMGDCRINTEVGISDAVLYLTAMNILIENDYIADYGNGLGTIKVDRHGRKLPGRTVRRSMDVEEDMDVDTEKNDGEIRIPTILYTMLNNATRYNTMIKTMVADHHRGNFDVFPIRIDESQFIQFTRECYYHKYVESVARHFKKPEPDITIKDVRTYLYKHHGITKGKTVQLPATRKKRMMVQRTIRLYCRHLLWVLNYWLNMYRCGGEYPRTPIIRSKNLPFYGWVQDGQTCKQGNAVSPLIHLDTPYIKLTDESEQSSLVENVTTVSITRKIRVRSIGLV